MFNFWWLAEWSEQITLTKTEKNEKGPLSHRKIMFIFGNVCFWITFNFWWSAEQSEQKNVDQNTKKWKRPPRWSAEQSEQKNVDQNTKKWKRPPRSLKNKMFVFWIMFNFWWSAEWSEQITLTETQKDEKSPPSHWKIKCLFLDYIQLLMIGRVIWAKNVDWNAKKWKRPPKSSKNKIFVFGLCSTSDDWPSDLSK